MSVDSNGVVFSTVCNNNDYNYVEKNFRKVDFSVSEIDMYVGNIQGVFDFVLVRLDNYDNVNVDILKALHVVVMDIDVKVEKVKMTSKTKINTRVEMA